MSAGREVGSNGKTDDSALVIAGGPLPDVSQLPDEAWVAALAGLPTMGPGRLVALLQAWPPRAAWDRVVARQAHHEPAVARACGRDLSEVVAAWSHAARRRDPAAIWSRHVEAGVGVAGLGSPAMPQALGNDIDPPGVLFHRGRINAIEAPRVGIVGTRSCSRYGREIAFELGHDLTQAGVAVVSGLALGIDGAAHAGAVSALDGDTAIRPKGDGDDAADADPDVGSDAQAAVDASAGAGPGPIAVVGNGLDIIYPLRNAELWRRVEACGVVFSEAPLGTQPDRWRFPARNRLIAALADVVVVVESHVRGGSMHTVTEAVRRGRTVLAVPGPIRSPASAGTNRLLSEGAAPVCDVDDVLVALGLSPGATRTRREARSRPSATGRAILDSFGWRPATLDQLCEATRLAPGTVASELLNLERTGHIVVRGAWYERVAHGN